MVAIFMHTHTHIYRNTPDNKVEIRGKWGETGKTWRGQEG